MKMIVVAIRDSAAGAFMRPFIVPATGLAVRSFQDEVNRAATDNAMYGHPEHFELFQLGLFDEETGALEPFDHARSLATGLSVKSTS